MFLYLFALCCSRSIKPFLLFVWKKKYQIMKKVNHGRKLSSRSYSFFFSLSSSLFVSPKSSMRRRASSGFPGASGMRCRTPVIPQTGFNVSFNAAPHSWHFATWRTPGRRRQNGMSGRSQHACSVEEGRFKGDGESDWLEYISHPPPAPGNMLPWTWRCCPEPPGR